MNEIGSRLCKEIESLHVNPIPDIESSIHLGITPEIKPLSWITYGATIQAEILNHGLDGYVFLNAICGPLCMLSEKTYMCPLIDNDTIFPLRRNIDITTTHDFQTMMFVELFLRNPNEKCGLMQEDEQPILSYWVHGIKEGKKREAKVEMIVDVDANHNVSIVFRDKDTNKELETVSHQHMFSLVANMSQDCLEQYRPAIYYEKDEPQKVM